MGRIKELRALRKSAIERKSWIAAENYNQDYIQLVEEKLKAMPEYNQAKHYKRHLKKCLKMFSS